MEIKEIGDTKDEEHRLNEAMIKDMEDMFEKHNGGVTKKEKKMLRMICNMRCMNQLSTMRHMLKDTAKVIVDKVDNIILHIDAIDKEIVSLKGIIGVRNGRQYTGKNRRLT